VSLCVLAPTYSDNTNKQTLPTLTVDVMEPRRGRGVRLLSLGESIAFATLALIQASKIDGGGIRGLSELLIIDHMMKRIKQEQRLAEVPKPCEYFDMIGGTSTGGWVSSILGFSISILTEVRLRLIALLLGRLRISTGDAIKCYADLSKRVFSAKQVGRDGKFSANKLRDVIREVVGKETGNQDELMKDLRPNACKVWVSFSSCSYQLC
jgi:hypothetical protein